MEMIWYPKSEAGTDNSIFSSVLYAGYHSPQNFDFDRAGYDNDDPIMVKIFNLSIFNLRMTLDYKDII